jgi:hypothetical protein
MNKNREMWISEVNGLPNYKRSLKPNSNFDCTLALAFDILRIDAKIKPFL